MTVLGIHVLDLLVLVVYFGLVLYLGVFLGASKTKTLGDFFVAGGKWGPLVSFIFVFASAIAGNEAVVVSGEAYHGGLSGVWYWWSFLFATPVYFLFATYYRRARVYNLAEFLEMRFGRGVAAFYSLVAGLICLLFIGMFVLAIGKILSGFADVPLEWCIGGITLIVAAYVCSGGMMSALLTDLLQGVMCLVILAFIMLPFLWSHAGGFEALRELPIETWDFTAKGMSLWKVVALNLSALAGGIAAPWIYNWMSISADEKAATQCAWGHLWKRLVTLIFALYGIFFAVLQPGLEDSELAWGTVMKEVLPVGFGVVGLMIASFFAAAMSSADTYAATSSAMYVDYFFRRVACPGLPLGRYLTIARVWAAASIVVAALSTIFISSIEGYVKLSLSLLSFLGIPIYFGVVWRKASEKATWLSFLLAISVYATLHFMPVGEDQWFADDDTRFIAKVFIPTALAVVGMWIGSLVWPETDERKLRRFFVIMNTPIGQEQRLVDAGINLPALVDAGLAEPGAEHINQQVLDELYEADAQQKMFGPESVIEVRRERLPWYARGFVAVTAGCVLLVVLTWLATRLLFVWT
ncbi:sodium:solute symporter family protein [Aeoliella sp.]|uniref:sodium:solute symporter family protein n=1 Tax=Aeoliella sp. TaxID=2795800 RepID=UPI003CCB7B91